MKTYRILALCLILLLAILGLNYWSIHYPSFLELYDIAFHLATTSGFVRCGGLPVIDFWEAPTPAGSPYHYFPFFLLPIVEALLLSSGVSLSSISYWLSWIFFPLSLFTAWLFMDRVYGGRAGLYSVALLSLPLVWVFNQWGRPAQALAAVLTPLVFLALAKRRYIAAGLLILCCVATHFFAIVLIPFLIIYALHARGQRRQVLTILAGLVFSGLVYFWLAGAKLANFYPVFISYSPIKDKIAGIFTHYHSFLGILALGGIIVCYRRKGAYFILPSYFLVSFLLTYFREEMRFWLGPAIFIFSCLGGIALDSLHNFIESRQNLIKGLSLSLLILLVSYTFFYVSLRNRPAEVRLPALFYLARRAPPPELTFSLADKFKIIELVKKHTASDEFFRVDSSMNINHFVSAYSLRSTLNTDLGNFPKGVKLIVAKTPPSDEYSLLAPINKGYNAYLLNDKTKAFKVEVPKPLITLKWLSAMVMLMLVVILFDIF